MSRSSSANALTLIEMVVVLAILAVLAGVAVRSLEPLADQTRYETTLRTLQAAQDAIVEDRLLSSGVRQASGFVADIGRLPVSTAMLTDPTGVTEFTSVTPSVSLSAFPFAPRSGPAASTAANSTNVDCTGVTLSCGWRGPYATTVSPTTGIVDGWGEPIRLEGFPTPTDDVHLSWTALTAQYADQNINVQRLALQTVSGVIQDTSGVPVNAEVVLVYPDPSRSTVTLSVMTDSDSDGSRFRFVAAPVGPRALVIRDPASGSQAIRYIDVTPMQAANLSITVTEFALPVASNTGA